jgi:ATP adenylyltransferase
MEACHSQSRASQLKRKLATASVSTSASACDAPGTGKLTNDILLKAGTLLPAIDERTRTALGSGALRPIATEQELIEDAGVRFLVRRVSSLRRKEAEKRHRASGVKAEKNPANPFLPPEPDLTVAEISRTHIALLNKFNVLDKHLLLVTKGFEHQETLITRDDFRALFACMAEYGGLGFYNGGAAAGASQLHKHLQLVPLPLAPSGLSVPVEPLLEGPGPTCPSLPFTHALHRLATSIRTSPMAAADEALSVYRHLLDAAGIDAVPTEDGWRQSAPYNLLIANDWMLLVPRVEEDFHGVSINALGFAGSLFVRDKEHLDLVRRAGPMEILQAVSGSAA